MLIYAHMYLWLSKYTNAKKLKKDYCTLSCFICTCMLNVNAIKYFRTCPTIDSCLQSLCIIAGVVHDWCLFCILKQKKPVCTVGQENSCVLHVGCYSPFHLVMAPSPLQQHGTKKTNAKKTLGEWVKMAASLLRLTRGTLGRTLNGKCRIYNTFAW